MSVGLETNQASITGGRNDTIGLSKTQNSVDNQKV